VSTPNFDLAVVPVAGRGLRLSGLPRQRPIPKAMIPLVGAYAIEFPLETLKRLGVRRACFVIGPQPEFDLLREFLGTGSYWGMEFSFIRQPDPLGLANALSLSRDMVSGPFAVVLGDDLTESDSIPGGVDLFFRTKAVALQYSILEQDQASISRSCKLEFDSQGYITAILEKPASPGPGYRGIGLYLFTPKLFDYLDRTKSSSRTGQVELTDTIALIAQDRLAVSHPIAGVNFNVNSVADLVSASNYLVRRLRGA
jgi:glucose-1-phosphate thymidylyltransferase